MNCGDVFRSSFTGNIFAALCRKHCLDSIKKPYTRRVGYGSASLYMCYARVKVSSVFKQCSKLEISNLFSTKSECGNEIFVEIFKFIEYANNTCYITLHKEF